MPELLEGRKPTGEVEIDWEHPLASGLVSFIPFNENSGTVFKDLTGGVGEFGSTPPTWVTGNGLLFDAAAESATLANGRLSLSNGDFTICIALSTIPLRGYIGTTDVVGRYSYNNSGWRLVYSNYTSRIQFITYQSGAKQSSQIRGVTANLVNLVIVKSGSAVNFYADGKFLANYATGVHANPDPYNGTLKFSEGSRYSGATHEGFSAYNRALSPQEIKSLNENPYQMLVPK